ncbi:MULTISPECIES: glycolate oxidase subunit GlcF [Hydrogenophilus]|uniref:Glycolate oxidase iron-sulfur subunit n=1 Tax=Hydrogenophilus thermoluteolus TaxID=297 RepID=A0A2Z6DVJ9_HYDTE|nr:MULTISPECIES: glycolate oxidase subunit GlcF [Hydrogenophilus]MBW7657692.1 glycolate oxidase subunit GlcF [Hydrogenophilus thermoluteolus]BBD76471.1 glycolate oxidase iron-sulfur subunit [Hydrogenophilus thermoluteolus]GLW61605.1 glycolate oxidase iron-sulfur subunit [Hydrogenophilus thermoluteolus]HNQ48907.1 glycolate oxidase subunit GlcF [Hydrogenophilus thermoluteolus]HNU19502.1 glycolate oxidase subunit GlcF [Hydrogenophilus thermoluteolus]
MQTHLAPFAQALPEAAEAEAILRKCVHCGFCTATCPTYQLLGDELDGPRGRIYQIKMVLEGAPATRTIQHHLDRCLTCRSCETTCPSGVTYHRLLDIGRAVVDAQVPRPKGEAWVRKALAWGLTNRPLFTAALRVGQAVRPLLPKTLAQQVPPKEAPGPWPVRDHPRRMWVVTGCVQPALKPGINAATARLFDALGITLTPAPDAGCCGAVEHHLGENEKALARARRHIDWWWPKLHSGEIEGVVVTASGCGAHVRDYAALLAHDPAYAEKARFVVERVWDPSEVVARFEADLLARLGSVPPGSRGVVAFHAPCTLQHGLKVRGVVERLLTQAGWVVPPVRDAHLCCGSAGTYSLLQREISAALKANKLEALAETRGQVIATANIGCLVHLQSGTALPVKHWVELLAEALPSAA